MGKAWPLALTPSNLIAGYTKTGIYPLNPGRITDKQKAPSAVYCDEKEDSQFVCSQSLENLSVVSPDRSADPPRSLVILEVLMRFYPYLRPKYQRKLLELD